jgi:hypothetical protein
VCTTSLTLNLYNSWRKIQQDATIYQNFIIPYFYEAQRVSGDKPPNIRSLKLYKQPLVFIIPWKVVERVASGYCQVQCAWQYPPTTRSTIFHGIMKNQRVFCSFRLLMLSGVSPETCWASYKYGIIKFWYIVVSCWIFLYELYYDSRNHKNQVN